MFYVIVFLWIFACALAYLFRHLRYSLRVRTCPCLALAGLLAAGVLFYYDNMLAGWIVGLASLYLAGTMFWSLKLNNLKN